MKRQLIIISNTGGKSNYVESVLYDRKNYLSFFRSCHGGAWRQSEIYAPETSTLSWHGLSDFMDQCGRVDFWVIVFTGHGWCDGSNETYIEPQPDTAMQEDIPVSWIRKRTGGSRCLLLADSCRSVISICESRQLKMRTFTAKENTDEYRQKCRNLYNRIIAQIPIGTFTTGYACQYGQKAGNIESGYGGLYTDAILSSVEDVIEECKLDGTSYVSFSYVHAMARNKVIRASNGKQVPVINHDRGNQIPFCVIP